MSERPHPLVCPNHQRCRGFSRSNTELCSECEIARLRAELEEAKKWASNMEARGHHFADRTNQEIREKKALRARCEKLENERVILAKHLGYQLCVCTEPPQIMVTRQERGVWLCERCGDTQALAALEE